MATKKKTPAKKVVEEVKEEVKIVEEVKKEEKPVKVAKKPAKVAEKPVKKQKYAIGSLVFVDKDTGADLNGFGLFPQFKKDPYTVEAYDPNEGVYTLRRQKLLIKLKEANIVAPDANAHDPLNRMQF